MPWWPDGKANTGQWWRRQSIIMEHSTHCEIACRSFIEMNPYYALDHPSLSTIHATIQLSNKVFQLCNYRGSESWFFILLNMLIGKLSRLCFLLYLAGVKMSNCKDLQVVRNLNRQHLQTSYTELCTQTPPPHPHHTKGRPWFSVAVQPTLFHSSGCSSLIWSWGSSSLRTLGRLAKWDLSSSYLTL